MTGKGWTYINWMVLGIIFSFHNLPTRNQYMFYNLNYRIIIITTYLPLHLLINSNVWYTRSSWVSITKPDILILSTRIWGNIQQNNIRWNYKTRPVTPYQKEGLWHTKILVIYHSDEKIYMGRKLIMLDHAYHFSIWQYDMFIMNEDHIMTEKRAYILLKRWWKRMPASNAREMTYMWQS